MKLIIGLGNPGSKYETSRHNLGFMVIDELVRQWKVSPHMEKKFSSLVFYERQRKLVIARPQLFMNQSGIAVARIANFYKIKPDNLWILHDDVDLGLGKLKIVKNRGSAGHKGVMSVINELKTIDFIRFRLGIGHPHSGRRMEGGKKVGKFDAKEEVEDFVLAPFSATEKDEVKKLIKKTIKAIELALEKGIEKAMNKYN